MKRTTKHTLGILLMVIAFMLLFAGLILLLILGFIIDLKVVDFPSEIFNSILVIAFGIFFLGASIENQGHSGLKPNKPIKMKKIIEGLEMIIEINDEMIADLLKYRRLWEQLKRFLDKKVEWNPIIRTAIIMKMEAMERFKEQEKTEQEIEQNIGAFMEWFGHDYREREIQMKINDQMEKYQQIFPQSDGYAILIQYDEASSLYLPVAIHGYARALMVLKNCVFKSSSPKGYYLKMRQILFNEFAKMEDELKRLQEQQREQEIETMEHE